MQVAYSRYITLAFSLLVIYTCEVLFSSIPIFSKFWI